MVSRFFKFVDFFDGELLAADLDGRRLRRNVETAAGRFDDVPATGSRIYPGYDVVLLVALMQHARVF